ncbi:MAG: hypothetical protein ABI183_17800 [Polyangiaceae bacterium]
MRAAIRATLASSVVALFFFSHDVVAAPQVSVGATGGFALTNLRDGSGPRPAFHLGVRGDLLFLRSREKDMAVGPYVEALTERFNSTDFGAGLEWLLPAIPAFPFVVSAGGFVHDAPGFGGYQPGVAATLFFGPRSYNFFSTYGLANGIFVQARYGLGDAKETDVLFGVQVDLAVLALPWILTYEAVAH